jgi:hypothetical protein
VKDLDLTNELVRHYVFGQGKVTHQEITRITIQFAREIGVKQFIYPDAFEKFLIMCNPIAAQFVLGGLEH